MNDDVEIADIESPNAYPPSIQAGIPKLGQTPSGWTRFSLGDLLRRIDRPAKLVNGDSYQLVTAKRSRGGIVAREVLRGDQIRTKTQFYVKAGDFLISNRQISHGACGVVPASLDGSVVSNEYTAFHTSEALDPCFLEALSHSIYFQQTCFHSSVGVHVEKLVFRLEDWLDWEFDIPPLAEQRRIVAVLDAWDQAIDQTERLMVASRKRRASLMLRLFGQAKVTSERILPVGWDRACVGDLCDFSNGLWVGNVPPFIRVGVIRNTNFTEDGTLDHSDIALLEVEEKQFKTRRLQMGDIILEKSGGGPDQPVGRVALFDRADGIYSFSNFTTALRVSDPARVGYRYLHQFLLWLYLSGLTEVMQARSTGLRNLDGDAYKNIIVPIPPPPQQRHISSVLEAEHASIIGYMESTRVIRTQKRGLMRKLLDGEWRLDERFNPLGLAPTKTFVGDVA
jgi:type I restriction enzyme, S subunit